MSVADGTADAVVVGGGTVGAWCAYFLRRAGLARVVLIEKGFLGQGASSRAPSVVRMQGGTPEAVRLGQWSRQFYLSQRDEIGTDSGFTEQGYLLPCFTEAEVAAAHARMAMQSALGVGALARSRRGGRGQPDARACRHDALGGTFCAQDGYITPAPQRGRLHRGADPPPASTVRGARRASRGRPPTGAAPYGRAPAQRPASTRGHGRPRRRPAARRRWRASPGLAHPGRRRPASGRGHRSEHPGLDRGPGAHGVRPGRPACTGGRRRAACCSG